MQALSTISTTGGRPLILMPLFFVISVCAIKDFIEDHKRAESDKLENSLKTEKWVKDNDFEEIKWENVKVGMIVKVYNDQIVPCDILLLSTSDPKGLSYVETKSLDGETNLKVKTARKKANEKTKRD